MGVGIEHRNEGRDLDDPAEVAEMVRRFYADVAQDGRLGPIFNEVAAVDWSEHLPKLTAFWCRALLSQPGYEGNPYRAHLLIHARQPFTTADFERWLELFHETLDGGWAGPKVDQAKALARKVAMVHSRQIIGEAVDWGPVGSAPAEPPPAPLAPTPPTPVELVSRADGRGHPTSAAGLLRGAAEERPDTTRPYSRRA